MEYIPKGRIVSGKFSDTQVSEIVSKEYISEKAAAKFDRIEILSEHGNGS
jgi:hypothetical protein